MARYLVLDERFEPVEEEAGSAGMGLLSTAPAWQGLAQQLASQWRSAGIDPVMSGIDRSDELARILSNYGITDLSKLGLKDVAYTDYEPESTGYGENASYTGAMLPVERTGKQLTYGDKAFGYLGGFGSKGQQEFGTEPYGLQQYMQDPNLLAWSAAGHGNVSYRTVQGPDGRVSIVPEWGSSSDWGDARTVAKLAAAVYGLGTGLEGLLASAPANGAFLGEGVLSGVPAWDAAATVAGVPLQAAAPMVLDTPLSSQVFVQDAAPLVSPPQGMLPAVEAVPAVTQPGLLSTQSFVADALPLVDLTSLPVPEVVSNIPAPSGLSTPVFLGEGVTSGVPAWDQAAAKAGVPMMDATLADPIYANESGKLARQAEIAADGGSPLGNMNSASTVSTVTLPKTGLELFQESPLAWLKANPELGRLLFSGAGALLGAAGNGGGAGSGYSYNGPMPTIKRGSWAATPTYLKTPPEPALSLPQAQRNDGLLRFLGG